LTQITACAKYRPLDERCRIVGTVGVAAPQVEGPARPEHAGDIAEPAAQQQLEGVGRQEVVGQGPVLGPEPPRGRLGLGGVAGPIQLLVVRGRLEGAQAGGDGVVGARLDPDVVRRVGVDHVDRRAAQQAIDVLGLARVAAQQAVFAQ